VVRRLTPAQYQAELRRQQREVDAYNRRVQQHNAKVTSEINAHNRDVADHNRKVVAAAKEQQRAVDKYNRQVTVHNQRVRANQQRLSREISHLQASTRSRAAIQPYETSVTTLRSSFSRLDAAAEGGLAVQDDLFDLSEGETANSVAALNALNAKPGPNEPSDAEVAELQETAITSEHVAADSDLHSRWLGALFALHPRNPDAARHFCTSARELLTRLLEAAAPDRDVERDDPECQRTEQGMITRRARIRYCLRRSGRHSERLEEFVEEDIANVITLFQAFNDGTHGGAGKFSLEQLRALKVRVEDAIRFVHEIAA
jgi:hypothetical protein